MRKVRAGFTILDIPEPTDRLGVLKFIERVGRVCYKSEDSITDESCVKFIQNLRDRKHWAMLEHYFFAMSVSQEIFDAFMHPQWYEIDNVDVQGALRFINKTYWKDSRSDRYKYIISGSATAFNNLWNCDNFQDAHYNTYALITPEDEISQIFYFLQKNIPELMYSPRPDLGSAFGGVSLLSREELRLLPIPLRLVHDWISIHFTTDRGVSHELVRHRPASWAQESTRFCNYSKGKHGKEITLLEPMFFDRDSEEYQIWEEVNQVIEDAYLRLTDPIPTEKEPGNTGEFGRQPQEARSILPNSTKTEIVMTATLQELHHFFKMRLPKTAHPQMREITIPLFRSLPGNYREIFSDLEEWIDEGVS